MDDRRQRLQTRVDEALREPPPAAGETVAEGVTAEESIMEFIQDPSNELVERLYAAALDASDAGVDEAETGADAAGARALAADAVAAALVEHDRLRAAGARRAPLRRALMRFVVHHPAARELGLVLPDLAETSPWKVLPSRRGPESGGSKT